MSHDLAAPSHSSRALRQITRVSFRPVRRRGAIVLAFHQVGVARFEAWIRLLLRDFDLVSLDELVQRRRERASVEGLVALTFDDGWAETCHPVAALCESERWPIMIYLVSSARAVCGNLWFSELPALLIAARGKRIQHEDWTLDLRNRLRTSGSTARLIARLKVLPGEQALNVVEGLRVAAGIPRGHEPRAFVDAGFVERYRDSRWVKFGSHSADHQAVAAQSDAGLHEQWSESQRSLESLARRPVRHFAYPYGAPGDVGSAAPVQIARYYDSAVTMTRGVCDSRTDLARIPRVPLYDGDGHARMIAKIALAPWF